MAEFREPKCGDVIWADRMGKGGPHFHCGIYEGGGYVIHYAGPKGSKEISQKSAFVHRISLADFKDGCPLKIIEFSQGNSAEETVRRARSRLGENKYSLLFNNCDHFATWCKTGKHRSIQVDDVKKGLFKLGGTAGKIICIVHDVVEAFIAASLSKIDIIQKPREISEKLNKNSNFTAAFSSMSDDEQNDHEQQDTRQEEFFDEEPGATPEHEDKSDGDDLPPEKKAWYEKVADMLKSLTYPIAGAFEILKRRGMLPPFLSQIDYHTLGAKIRNTIDYIVITIKVFTGRLTPAQAREEIGDNEAATLGAVIFDDPGIPVRKIIKWIFGRIGLAIMYFVLKAIERFLPRRVREAIKKSYQEIVRFVIAVIWATIEEWTTRDHPNRGTNTNKGKNEE